MRGSSFDTAWSASTLRLNARASTPAATGPGLCEGRADLAEPGEAVNRAGAPPPSTTPSGVACDARLSTGYGVVPLPRFAGEEIARRLSSPARSAGEGDRPEGGGGGGAGLQPARRVRR